jgi:hypothetical protein
MKKFAFFTILATLAFAASVVMGCSKLDEPSVVTPPPPAGETPAPTPTTSSPIVSPQEETPEAPVTPVSPPTPTPDEDSEYDYRWPISFADDAGWRAFEFEWIEPGEHLYDCDMEGDGVPETILISYSKREDDYGNETALVEVSLYESTEKIVAIDTEWNDGVGVAFERLRGGEGRSLVIFEAYTDVDSELHVYDFDGASLCETTELFLPFGFVRLDDEANLCYLEYLFGSETARLRLNRLSIATMEVSVVAER